MVLKCTGYCADWKLLDLTWCYESGWLWNHGCEGKVLVQGFWKRKWSLTLGREWILIEQGLGGMGVPFSSLCECGWRNAYTMMSSSSFWSLIIPWTFFLLISICLSKILCLNRSLIPRCKIWLFKKGLNNLLPITSLSEPSNNLTFSFWRTVAWL